MTAVITPFRRPEPAACVLLAALLGDDARTLAEPARRPYRSHDDEIQALLREREQEDGDE